MAKPEWGVKRLCPACGARFYDLMMEPVTCPACNESFTLEQLTKPRRGKSATAPAKSKAKAAPVVEEIETDEIEDPITSVDDDDDAVLDLDDDDNPKIAEATKGAGAEDDVSATKASFDDDTTLDDDEGSGDDDVDADDDDISLEDLEEPDVDDDDEDDENAR